MTPPNDNGSGRKKKRGGRGSGMSVAERLQNQALSPSSQGDMDHEKAAQRPPPPEFDKYDQATIRVIAQFLDSVGLQSSAEALVEESGFTIEASAGARIRSSILKGNYDAACQILKQSQDLAPETARNASYIIQCFKIADLARKGRFLDALITMRDVYPKMLGDKAANLDFMDSFTKDIMLGEPRYHNVDAADSRNNQLAFLEELLPTNFILPQNRLKSLLHKLHGVTSDEKADRLLRDGPTTAATTRPYTCVEVWEEHTSPVYVVKFSRNGKLMASGGKSNAIDMWNVKRGKLHMIGPLAPIPEGNISYMEFSQSNQFLAVCGECTCKYNLTVFNVESRHVFRTLKVHTGHDEIVDISSYFTCCSFLTSSVDAMVIAGNELGALKVYSLNQPEEAPPIKSVSGFRVRFIYGMKDGDGFMTVDAHNRVRLYSISTDMNGITICKEDVTIMSMVVHPSEKLVLTTTECNLRLWDIRSHTLVRVFSGCCQREEFAKYSIHGTFGGVHYGFIATGSIGKETAESLRTHDKTKKKDGRVVIWSVEESRPRFEFVGHRGHVNAVAWHPKDPTMLVSSGDDCTIRVWKLEKSETSELSNIVPKMITKREKYGPREEEPTTSAEGCQTAAELVENIQKLEVKDEKEKFVEDLDMELKWVKGMIPWRTDKDII